MSNVITNSRMRTYRECARKHEIEYELGYRPTIAPEYFRFGHLWHSVTEAYLAGLAEADVKGLRDHHVRAFAETKAKMRFDEIRNGKREVDPFFLANAAGMLDEYFKWMWSTDFHDKFEVIGVEVPFAMPMVNPESGRSSRTWVVRGVVDAALRVRSTGRLWILERKTTSESISGDTTYFHRLAMDGQCSVYFLGAMSLYGEKPDGIIYEVAKKVKRDPLKKSTEIRYKKRTKKQIEEGVVENDPSLVYAGTRLEDETPTEYSQRIQKVIFDRGWAEHFTLHSVARPEGVIEEWMRDAWYTARNIRSAQKDKHWTRNPDNCFKYGSCPYWTVCTNQTALNDTGHFRSLGDNVHPELPESI